MKTANDKREFEGIFGAFFRWAKPNRFPDLGFVSKDADFSDRIITNSPPPRVVHLRFGNLRRNEFHVLLPRIWPQVESLLKTHKLVNVYADRLEGVG